MAAFSNSRLTPGVHQRLTDADVVALTAEAVQSLNVLTAETVDMLDAIELATEVLSIAERTAAVPVVAGLSGIELVPKENKLASNVPTQNITQQSWLLPTTAPLPSLNSAFSRRRAMFGAATVAAVSLSLAGAATVAAMPADPDAELIALGREWQAADDHCDNACDALDATAERLGDIDPPEAMFRRLSDSIAFTWLAHRFRETKRLWFPRNSVEKLRTYEFVNPWGDPLVRDQARRDEIVAAYDAWRAEIAADEQARGYSAAFATYEAAVANNHQLRRRIISMRATTLAGVMVKALVVKRSYGDLAELQAELEHSLGEGASDADTMAISVIVDLLSMQARVAVSVPLA